MTKAAVLATALVACASWSAAQEPRYPTRAELDLAAPQNPVLFSTGPDASLNTLALKLSGIDRDFKPTDGFQKTTLPGGRYAALAYLGTPDGILQAWNALLRDWLPASGFQLDHRPAFEYYPVDNAYDPATGAFECWICIPIAPL